jgi:glycerol-3-phosphate dehydrogenase
MHRESISKLKTESFDLLVIGGGATGCGIALDASSRGLKTALIEKYDFSSGTSSRSTKLIHGGVRYLEQAFIQFDRSQYNLVKDALKERYTLLKIAPHLVKPIPILTPLYTWASVPYYLTGLKLYDRLSGKYKLHKSEYINSDRTLELFPLLQRRHLRGSVLYYDAQFDDARMNILLARTAEKQGAIVSNYVEVKNLKKTKGLVTGVEAYDVFGKETFSISAKVVINATGPYVDTLRKLDNPATTDMVEASSGSHMVLDRKFCSNTYGLLIPKTDDNRVLFFLPWNGHTLVGTTDNAAPISDNPKASLEDRDYLIRQIKNYFTRPISTKDVLATWSGLRPLIKNPGAKDTARLSRDHEIEISESNLITIAGGKWTTFRKMAEDAVDTALTRADLRTKNNCLTEDIKLLGSENYNPNAF